jgi:uncharacterized protein (TIGR03435 family)
MRGKVSFLLIATLPFVAAAQDAPRFEAASVKPTEHGKASPNATGYSFVDVPDPGHLRAQNSNLDELIRFAWSLKDGDVTGPVWLTDSFTAFDITASAPANASKDQMRLMMRTLLAERFHLTTHFENRMVSGYELVVGKKGAKLIAAKPEEQQCLCGRGGFNVTKVNLTDFANYVATDLKAPVMNKTGIDGVFDIAFQYDHHPDATSTLPSLFTALEETTGLQLKSAKVPVQILVVDHAEKAPTAN